MQALTMELHLSQKKADDLEKRLAEESRSHNYFKSRLATVKAQNSVPKADSDAVFAEITALSAEKEAWLAEKESLLQETARLTSKLDKFAKDCQTAASARIALLSALDQTQQELEKTKAELATHRAETLAIQDQRRAPTCAICFEHAISVAFDPCGHACVCKRCGDLCLSECPICKQAVSTQIKLHFA